MKCHGCGVQLQTSDPTKIGYIPENAMLERSEPLCQRCYRIKHYSENIAPEVVHYSLSDLRSISAECDVTFVVVDLLDIEGTWSKSITDAVKGDLFVVLNKFDLIPKHILAKQIVEWFSTEYNIKPKRIQPVSSLNNFGIKNLTEQINHTQKCCFTGATNAGKSTLLNTIISKEGLSESTVSPFSGTTLGRVKRTLKSGTIIIDTPGIEVKHRMMQFIKPEERHLIFKTDKLTRKTYKPEPGKTIFFGGLCRIDVVNTARDGYEPIFQLFSGHNVVYHSSNQKKADELHKRQFGKMLKPPFSSMPYQAINWQPHKLKLLEGEDLAISGLGWINVKRGPLEIVLTLPRGTGFHQRKAILRKER
ncbi:MAG: GTPase [Thermotogota bacterium]